MINFQYNIRDWWLRHLSQNCTEMNGTGSYWWWINICLEVMARCHQATSHYLSQCWSRSMLHMASQGHNELKLIFIKTTLYARNVPPTGMIPAFMSFDNFQCSQKKNHQNVDISISVDAWTLRTVLYSAIQWLTIWRLCDEWLFSLCALSSGEAT